MTQEIQCEKGKETLNAKNESDDEETISDIPLRSRQDSLGRRSTLSKTTINGIVMVSDLPDVAPPADKDEKTEKKGAEIDGPKILSKDESKAIQQKPEFATFFMKAARLVERGLYSEDDVLGSFERLEVEKGDANTTKDNKMIDKVTFMKDNPTKRAITNLDWSSNYKELFLCSYHVSENEWDSSETDGLVNIFSTQMPSQPELTLTCQSEITACVFHPMEPYLVIGGTFAGSVIVWDMREKRNYPIVKTPTTDSCIKSIKTYTKDNHYNNIISVSNDGKVCVWTLNMMKEPQKKIDLMSGSNEVIVHC